MPLIVRENFYNEFLNYLDNMAKRNRGRFQYVSSWRVLLDFGWLGLARWCHINHYRADKNAWSSNFN